MSKSIKIRTELRDNKLTVRMLIRHAMQVGGRRREGEVIAAHFITELSCKLNDEVVMKAHWGPGISKNPYLSLVIDGAATGDELAVRWVDNQGQIEEIKTLV